MGRIYKNGINYSGGIVPAPIANFYSNNLYLSNTASDVSTYKTLSYGVDFVETEKALTLNASQGEQLSGVYLYPTQIGTTTIDAGLWSSSFTIKVSSTAGGSTTMRIECFVRHINNSETVLFSKTTDPITSIEYSLFETQTNRSVFTLVSTDRLGFKIYATTTRAQDTTLTYIIGNGRATHFTVPIALRHSQLRNKNEEADYQHITTAEKTDLQTPAFTEVSTLANIASGETIGTLWGKILKFFNIWGTNITKLANAYSTSSTYGVGAYVSYNNKLYRCSTAITVAEAWTVGKWTNITMTNILYDLCIGELSPNLSYIPHVGASFISKTGRTVELNISITNTVAIPTNTTVLTLPVGYRPNYSAIKYFVVRSLNDATASRLMSLDSNGLVKFADNNGNVPIGAYLDGHISFTTNQ